MCAAVDWGSKGYLFEGRLMLHADAPFVRMGDAGRWGAGPNTAVGTRPLVVMDRLRPPLLVRRGGLRLQLQAYEVEAALLAADASADAAAALQGPDGTLLCAVAGPRIKEGNEVLLRSLPVLPDQVLRLPQLPTSPAGKVLYSQLAELFAAKC